MAEIEWVVLGLALAHLVVGFAATVYISASRPPAAAVAWVLAIIFIPFLGAIWYLLVGAGRLPRSRRDKQGQVSEAILARNDVHAAPSSRSGWPEWLESAVRMNVELGSLPMVGGNSAELLESYHGSFARMVTDIDAATDHVHVEFYILVLDPSTAPVFAALSRACERGVTVRVLSDHVSGFLAPRRSETLQALKEMGAEWHPMLPLRPFRGQWQRADLRNHRKLVVIDGRIGYTGSQNLIDPSYLKKKNIARGLQWLELMVRLQGPVVRELDAVFVTDWFSETDRLLALDPAPGTMAAPSGGPVDAQVVPSGPSFENDNNLKLFVYLIHSARRRISITSPYFIPDESTLLAMVAAASRGIDIELFVSAIGDQFLVHHAQHSYYEALLRAGVIIRLYRAPTVLHSKHVSIDDDVAVVGSSNMDIRSFRLNMEVSVVLHGRAIVQSLRAVEDRYRADSDELSLEQWTRRRLIHKVGDSLARLTSSLQ